MKIIVPLAGPDFEGPDGTVKALRHDGAGKGPLLKSMLETRPWWMDGSCRSEDLVFVLVDRPTSRNFHTVWLVKEYPHCKVVWLSEYVRGAALSSLAGIAMIAHCDEPVIVDFADIFFESQISIRDMMLASPEIGGIVPIFSADNPLYSYVRLDDAGWVVESVEKQVISNHASVGTYIFRSPRVFLHALADNLSQIDKLLYNNLLYVCPMMNGIVGMGLRVLAHPVQNVYDMKVDAASAR